MRALCVALDWPQRRYRTLHVVGTTGKSSVTTMTAALLRGAGLATGACISPHVWRWAERTRIDGAEIGAAAFAAATSRVADAIAAVEPDFEPGERITQFEAAIAVSFTAFAAAGVDVAVVEAGLGGRLDATNVLRSHVVVLTNVGLEHTDVLGGTRDLIAAEKLAVVQAGTVAVLPDEEFAHLAGPNVVVGGAREAAAAFLGRAVEREVEVALPGRLERRGDEIRDGAHNADGVRWLVAQLDRDDYTVVASILRDKDALAMLSALATRGRRFVATESPNERALPAAELAHLASHHVPDVEIEPDPAAALALAREQPPVLVTGSLYLLAALARNEA